MAYNYNQPPEFNTDLLATPETAQVRLFEGETKSAETMLQEALRGNREPQQVAGILGNIFKFLGAVGTAEDAKNWSGSYFEYMQKQSQSGVKPYQSQSQSGSSYQPQLPYQQPQQPQSGYTECDQNGNCRFVSTGSYGQ